jgi:hypothetical protein
VHGLGFSGFQFFFCSQAESTPAHTSSTQTFGQFHFDIKYPLETAILEINDAMNAH